MTEQEYFRLAEPRVEYVRGEALFMSPVSLFHADLVGFLYRYLHALSSPSNLGRVFLDTVAVRLSPQVTRVPDLCFVLAGNPRVVFRDNHIDGPPDLIIEVVSAESRTRDYVEKLRDYEAAGVTEYWVIDPVYQAIDLFRLVDGRYQSAATDGESPPQSLTSLIVPRITLKPAWLRQTPLPDVSTLLTSP